MKMKLALASWMLLLTTSIHGQSPISYSATLNTAIPDDNPNGLSSTIHASGISGTVQSITVGLDIANGYNGDYYAYLVSPGGAQAVLLNRVGVGSSSPFGYSDTGFHVTLSSGAANNIHSYQSGSFSLDGNGALTGTWAADGRNLDPGSSPLIFDSASSAFGLNQILGTQPNGDWTLFIADLSGGFQGTLQDWQLNLVTVPEPSLLSLLGLAGAVATVALWRRRAHTD